MSERRRRGQLKESVMPAERGNAVGETDGSLEPDSFVTGSVGPSDPSDSFVTGSVAFVGPSEPVI